jgi:hypothetical protein
MEDKLRKKAMSPSTLREAFQLISAADRVLANVSAAGKKLMEELTPGSDEVPVQIEPPPEEEPGVDDDPQAEDPPASD